MSPHYLVTQAEIKISCNFCLIDLKRLHVKDDHCNCTFQLGGGASALAATHCTMPIIRAAL